VEQYPAHRRAAGNAEYIQLRTAGECLARQDLEADVTQDQLEILPDEMDVGVRRACQDLKRSRHVELVRDAVEHEHKISAPSKPCAGALTYIFEHDT
jgi:hypothetical protein